MTDSRYDVLFEPVRIGPVVAPNRFYAVPHATGQRWSQPNAAIALRAMKAEGGWGTVAVQMTEISPCSDLENHPLERLWDDSDIPRHAAQVEAIRKHGSLAAIELAHGGGRARNLTTGIPVIGPSALPIFRPEMPIQAMALDAAGIREFRAGHKAAVRRAIQADYDIIYVYAAHDLSIFSHFLSVNTNRRSDGYGGSFENRLRLLREVLEDTIETVAGRRAVAIRFSVAEPGRKNGLTAEGEGRDAVEALAELPDLWDVNISGWPNDGATARFADEGFQLRYTGFVKGLTTKPVVGVGRFTSPDLMVSLIRKGELDLIGGARPSIADPFLPEKIRQGRIEDLRECIGCNICVSMDSYGVGIRCTQNPTVSEEWRRGWHPEAPAISRGMQSHLIVGSGPAGLECAVTLLRAGHMVTVAEASGEVGGRIAKESRLPGLNSWLRVRDHRTHLLSQSNDAEVYVSSRMSAGDIADFGADTVVLATGSCWRTDGVGSTNFDPIEYGGVPVLGPDDILADHDAARKFSRVAIHDDEHFYMASSLAELLALKGMRIDFMTPLPAIAHWTDMTLEQGRIVDRLVSLGVELHPNVKLTDGAGFACTLTGRSVKPDFDAIVQVGARAPNDRLRHELANTEVIGDIHLAGDCVVPGTIQAAVYSGHRIAREILGGEKPAAKRDQVPVS